ncbi:MAG TPA: hypothetical protein DCL04_02225, partial [Synergistaceae bacterium]|nr:hypothetical protein [Synergistaceae bacterium]
FERHAHREHPQQKQNSHLGKLFQQLNHPRYLFMIKIEYILSLTIHTHRKFYLRFLWRRAHISAKILSWPNSVDTHSNLKAIGLKADSQMVHYI